MLELFLTLVVNLAQVCQLAIRSVIEVKSMETAAICRFVINVTRCLDIVQQLFIMKCKKNGKTKNEKRTTLDRSVLQSQYLQQTVHILIRHQQLGEADAGDMTSSSEGRVVIH